MTWNSCLGLAWSDSWSRRAAEPLLPESMSPKAQNISRASWPPPPSPVYLRRSRPFYTGVYLFRCLWMNIDDNHVSTLFLTSSCYPSLYMYGPPLSSLAAVADKRSSTCIEGVAMENINNSNNDDGGHGSAAHSGHWLPALRPEVLEDESGAAHDGGSPANPDLDSAQPKSVSKAHIVEDPEQQDRWVAKSHPTAPQPTETPPASKSPSWLPPPDSTSAEDEIPSDEDEERLDPAWGIKRQDTANLLDKVNRSTSFPDFSASVSTSPPRSTSISMSAHLAENTVDGITHNGISAESISTQQGAPFSQHQGSDWLEEEESHESSLHAGAEQAATSQPLDAASVRFEEGIPLIQKDATLEDNPSRDAKLHFMDDLVDDSLQDDEASFFSKINAASRASEAPTLNRKSTAQVIGALHVPDDTPDSPGLDEPQRSGVAKEPTKDLGSDSLDATAIPDKVDVDNDAMWKAAFDDDEFLVEDADDLLPDSEPGSPSFLAAPNDSVALQDDKFDVSSIPPTVETPEPQNHSQYAQADSVRNQPPNLYTPHQPSTADMLQLSPTTYGSLGFSRPGLAPMESFQAHLQQTPVPPHPAESFADQSKDGYRSPYDLPLELTKPRKRVHVPHPVQTSKSVPPPPPRSSSLSDKPLQSPFTPSPTSPSAYPSASMQPRSIPDFTEPSPEANARPASSSFFEELPISSKPRSATSHGRYTPVHTTGIPPPQLLPRSPPPQPTALPQAQTSPPRLSDPYVQYQLRPPERLDPYANVPLHAPLAPPAAASTSRYSPAPVSLASGLRPTPSPRYSPAPPPQAAAANLARYATQPTPPTGQSHTPPPALNRYASKPSPNPPPPTYILPFQPRTSSPLAHHKTSVDEQTRQPFTPPPSAPKSTAFSTVGQPPVGALPRSVGAPANVVDAPEGHSPTRAPVPDTAFVALPRRSQTQSPGKQRPQSNFSPLTSGDSLHRPASVHGEMPPGDGFAQLSTIPPSRPSVQARGLVQELDFVRPTDDTQFDPLERWKGAPVFRFGFGGTIVSTFPKHVPRYAAGAVRPQIKSSAGDVSTRHLKDIVPLPEDVAGFPGPLRSKSKKKEVLSWMAKFIAKLESELPDISTSAALPDPKKRHDEKVLLWKLVRTLVEHDGLLDGNGEALKATNLVLLPEVHALDESTASHYHADDHLSGIYRPAGPHVQSDLVDPMAVEVLRKHLLKGNREQAVWHAVDSRLWSHALLISSTLDRSVWKQVVREFVRQEVKTIGANAQSLSALYEIFGGNLEESIDQLVPPSARAGLQMVSKVDAAGPTKNAFDGLDRWRETLGLVLNNRSPGDQEAVIILGKLLADYGRIEAAHICYLFSRSPAQPVIMGGADEPQAHVVLLGADHRASPFDLARDHESILLTEIYEFATHVLAVGSVSTCLPHLSVYKLQRAMALAEGGLQMEAQAYCDAIAATLKSSTKVSPYYHPVFLAELDELSSRLKQTPVQSPSSWIAKPSLEKVSGSVWNKFSSFVAGEDSDAESKGSAKDASEAGPFAKISATPSLSRSGSQSDLYGSYPMSMPPPAPTTVATSRYAPNGIHSTRSSSELIRGRPSFDSQRSPPPTSHSQSSRHLYEPMNLLQPGQTQQPINPYQSLATPSPTTSFQQSPPRSTYLPSNALQQSPPTIVDQPRPVTYEPMLPTDQSSLRIQQPNSAPTSETAAQPAQQTSFGGYLPRLQPEGEKDTVAPNEAYNGNYNPPSQSYGYEPPDSNTGYVPYEPGPDSSEEDDNEPAKPKKSFMDDDGDADFPKISNHTASDSGATANPSADEDAARRRANDAAADAAFRAAAEADAAREKERTLKPKPSSWFGSWLGGKKSDSLDGKGAEPKVYQANLGESKMKLYYDKELGKWVNPDNPDAAKKSATPPPPRMGGTPAPPPAAGSGQPPGPPKAHAASNSFPSLGSGPPSGSLSRAGTPASGAGIGSTPASALPPRVTDASGPPSGNGTPAPPLALGSRPGTSMSNASSIDDLIGPPTGRKAAKGRKGVKGGRYIDVMAK